MQDKCLSGLEMAEKRQREKIGWVAGLLVSSQETGRGGLGPFLWDQNSCVWGRDSSNSSLECVPMSGERGQSKLQCAQPRVVAVWERWAAWRHSLPARAWAAQPCSRLFIFIFLSLPKETKFQLLWDTKCPAGGSAAGLTMMKRWMWGGGEVGATLSLLRGHLLTASFPVHQWNL